MDQDGNGKIDFSEFVAAAYDRSKLLNSENIKIAFNMFDIERNGKISRQELERVLGNFKENSVESL